MLLEKISQLNFKLIIILAKLRLAIAFRYFCKIGMHPIYLGLGHQLTEA